MGIHQPISKAHAKAWESINPNRAPWQNMVFHNRNPRDNTRAWYCITHIPRVKNVTRLKKGVKLCELLRSVV